MSSSSIEAFMAAHIGPTVPVQQNLVPVLQVLGELGLRFKLYADTPTITSLHVQFPDTDLELSVQTAAGVTHFPGVVCETALWHGEGLVYVDELGYSDVCKFTRDEFKEKLIELKEQVKGKMYAEFKAAQEFEELRAIEQEEEKNAKKRHAEEEEEEASNSKKARVETAAPGGPIVKAEPAAAAAAVNTKPFSTLHVVKVKLGQPRVFSFDDFQSC